MIRSIKTRTQLGAATILLTTLIALGTGLTIFSAIHNLNGLQKSQTSLMDISETQRAAWHSLEMIREYLNQTEDLDFSDGFTLSASNNDYSYSVVDPTVSDPRGYYFVTATNNKTQSKSTIQAVLRRERIPCINCVNDLQSMAFYNNITVDGELRLDTTESDFTLYVEGNITTNDASVYLMNVHATGDINFGENTMSEILYSNGDVTLTGFSQAAVINALGDVTLSSEIHFFLGGATAQNIYANGNAILSGGDTTNVNVLGGIIQTSGSHGKLIANQTVDISGPSASPLRWRSTNLISEVNAGDDITITSDVQIDSILGKSDIYCPGVSWSSFSSVTVKGAAHTCPPEADSFAVSAESISFPQIIPLNPIDMPKPVVDVSKLKNAANFAFEIENDDIKVTVLNVNGLSNGTYYLGDYASEAGRGHKDYLCKDLSATRIDCLTSSGTCDCMGTPSDADTATICFGETTSDSCINYDDATETWHITGQRLAPGTVWFEGNVHVDNGALHNTVLATKNITTATQTVVRALNYAASTESDVYSDICNSVFLDLTVPDFNLAPTVPTDICDLSTQTLRYSPLANVALMAGSYESGTFVGGDITFGNETQIFGTVVAGDSVTSDETLEINGGMLATSQDGGTNTLGSSTTINTGTGPSSYQMNEMPVMDETACDEICTMTQEELYEWVIKSARYL